SSPSIRRWRLGRISAPIWEAIGVSPSTRTASSVTMPNSTHSNAPHSVLPDARDRDGGRGPSDKKLALHRVLVRHATFEADLDRRAIPNRRCAQDHVLAVEAAGGDRSALAESGHVARHHLVILPQRQAQVVGTFLDSPFAGDLGGHHPEIER